MWAASFGSLGYDSATSVAIAPDGSVYVVGTFSGIVDFGGGPLASAGGADLFVLKLDPNGKQLWSERFGGVLDDQSVSLALTAAGDPLIGLTSPSTDLDLGGGPLLANSYANFYLVQLDAAGNHLWSRAYDGAINVAQIAIAPNGDIVVAASFYDAELGIAGKLESAGSNDVLLARLDSAGEPLWAKRFGSVWGDMGAAVAVAADGAIYLDVRYSRSWSFGGKSLPNSKGAFSVGVAKFDGNGTYRWSRGWPNGYDHYATGIAVDNRGAIWVTGDVRGSVDAGTGPLPASIGGSALVVKLDAETGDTEWAGSFGEHTMRTNGVASDGQGGAFFSGIFKGNAEFGNNVTLSEGTGQPYVAHLDATGNALWARAIKGVGESATLTASPEGQPLVLAGGYRGTLDIGVGVGVGVGDTDAFVVGLLP